jgi:hypothetical protein
MIIALFDEALLIMKKSSCRFVKRLQVNRNFEILKVIVISLHFFSLKLILGTVKMLSNETKRDKTAKSTLNYDDEELLRGYTCLKFFFLRFFFIGLKYTITSLD